MKFFLKQSIQLFFTHYLCLRVYVPIDAAVLIYAVCVGWVFDSDS